MYRNIFLKKYIENGFSNEEAKSEIDFAMDILFDYKYKNYLLGEKLDKDKIDKLNQIIDIRVKTGRPMQQIVGQAFFLSRRFIVNEYTLIPRPETEILVNEILNIPIDKDIIKVLDIGTGSGCIPISLVLENNKIYADSVDISLDAIKIAKENASVYNVSDRVNFFESDLFENVSERYNIIVSNPPYIPLADKESLQTEVKIFEPSNALFTNDEEGIEFYQKIADSARKYLYDGGYLCFELGINQSILVKNLLINNGYKEIRIIKDLNNIDRVIIAKSDN